MAAPALLIALAVAVVFVPAAAAGTAAATFQAHQEVATGPGPLMVAIGDLNRDGRPDLVTANSGGGLWGLVGTGDGAYQAEQD